MGLIDAIMGGPEILSRRAFDVKSAPLLMVNSTGVPAAATPICVETAWPGVGFREVIKPPLVR